jgi:energy-coupling factor transporter ATP-binding protein EcfA2
MRRIDIFVSSPPDVQSERTVVERLIESIALEHDVPVAISYANRLRKPKLLSQYAAAPANGHQPDASLLCPCFWEYQDTNEEHAYHEQVPNTGQYDLVICILWSRLGTRISPSFVMPDGRPPSSATEYEIGWVLDQKKRTPGFPELRVYRNLSIPVAPLEPKKERQSSHQRWDSVQEFFSIWTSKSAFQEACSEYRNLREFESLFRKHFQEFVTKQLERTMAPRKPASNLRHREVNPFRGLQSFNFGDAAFFHGRTKAIGEVLDILNHQANAGRPFVLILGPNGSGKSSLVQAGVLPFLTEIGSPPGPWRRAITRPGTTASREGPFHRLAAALLAETALPELKQAGNPNPEAHLASELLENPPQVAQRILKVLDRAGWQEPAWTTNDVSNHFENPGSIGEVELTRNRRLMPVKPVAHLALVIDPLEELFTENFPPDLQRGYIAALGVLVRTGRVFAVATLQSDCYSAYQQFPELIDLTGSIGKYDLRLPTPEEIGDMIREPAKAVGLRFEQDHTNGCGLDKVILEAALSSPEPLPLLQHLLSQLYRKQAIRRDGLFKWSDYLEGGRFERALAKHAETLFTTLRSDAQGAFDFVMRQLIGFGNGGQGIRRTVLYHDIVASAGLDRRQKEAAQNFVDSFIKEGLFYAEPGGTPESLICLSHQTLLRRWPRVRQWLAEQQAFLRMRDRLDSSLGLWLHRNRRDEDLLESSLGVADAENLLRHFRPSLSKTQTEYLEKILRAEKHKRWSRRGIWMAAGAVFVLLAALGGIEWYNLETQKNGMKELARLEGQIVELVNENRNGQKIGSPKSWLKDSSQTVITKDTDQPRSSDPVPKPAQRNLSAPLATGQSMAIKNGSRDGGPQSTQIQKAPADQPGANNRPESTPGPKNELPPRDDEQSKLAQNDQNENGESPANPAVAGLAEANPADGNTDGVSDEQQLKNFVADYLQTVASDDVSSQERFFARRVTYFDQGVISLRRVQAAKESYNHAWPTREWKPRGDAEVHETSNSRLYEIVQPYSWTASDGSRLDQGSGTLFIRVYKTAKGDPHIVHIERRD